MVAEEKTQLCLADAGTNTKEDTMNTHHTTSDRSDKGFTLVEILIAIVLVGILSAVAVVGISNLVSKGSTSACSASADAAKAGSAVYFASNSAYPADFLQLTTAGTNGAPMTLPSGVTGPGTAAVASGTVVVHSGTSWTLTMTPGTGNNAPTFACT